MGAREDRIGRRRRPMPAIRQQVDGGTAALLPDVDRPEAYLLTLDGTPQSYVDLRDPTYLEFEYVRRLGHVVDLAAPTGAPLRAVHLGGGALSLPRYLAATRPHSRQLVVDYDAALIELIRRELPWPRGWRIRVRAADAREALAGLRPDDADVVIADAFAGARTPAHLTSVEFVRLAAAALRASGMYAVNLADSAPLAFARAQTATIASVLPQVCLIVEPSTLRGRRFGNLVVVASRAPLPVAELTHRAAADPFAARVLAGEELTRWIGGAAPVLDAVATPSPPPPAGAFSL